MTYPTQNEIPSEYGTWDFLIPLNRDSIALLIGCLRQLEIAENYHRAGTLTEDEMTSIWKPVIDHLLGLGD